MVTLNMIAIPGCSAAEQGNLRLANTTSPLEGRIEICNNRRWGTVCDDRWGNPDADVACRQLGFSGTGQSLTYAREEYSCMIY